MAADAAVQCFPISLIIEKNPLEFGRHIGKGIWGFADKGLPAVYGLGFVFLVIRVLPEAEYGAFVIVQAIFLLATALGTAFALQPLTKFAAETEDYGPYVVASLLLSVGYYLVVSILLLVFKGPLVSLLDPKGHASLSLLLNYIPVLFAVALYRAFAINLLQASYQVQKIFWIDAVYFIGTIGLIYTAEQLHRFSTAQDILLLSVVALATSSLLAFGLTYRPLVNKMSFHWQAFSKIWHFGKYTFGGNAMYAIFSQLDVIFVSTFVGVTSVAVYNAAKILTRLFDMLSQVLQMFLIPFSSRAYALREKEELTVVAEKSICFSTIILLPVLAVMLIFPEPLLHILYKGRYDAGASILRIFSFLALIVPWNAVVSSYMIGMGKVKQGFVAGIGLVVIALPAYVILTPVLGGLGTSIGLVGSIVIVTLAMVLYLYRTLPLQPGNVIRRALDAWTFIKRLIPLEEK